MEEVLVVDAVKLARRKRAWQLRVQSTLLVIDALKSSCSIVFVLTWLGNLVTFILLLLRGYGQIRRQWRCSSVTGA